jgi:hypothetical protein
MMGRPMLRAKVLGSTAETWFGRPLRDIPDGDMWRFWALRVAAGIDYAKWETEGSE